MRNIFFPFFLLLFLSAGNLHSQKLDFLGLTGIHFGMKAAEMTNKVVILDSTSVYKDTALYLRNNRCLTYFRNNDTLQLRGFLASSIQYQFCNKELAYVFINVSGEKEIEKTLAELQKTFKKLGCKGKPLKDCTQIDSYAKGIRIIINIDRKKQLMNFVLIPKAPAK